MAQPKSAAYPLEWDLTPFYKSIDDPKILSDLEHVKKLSAAFEKKHRGKIKSYSDLKIRSLLEELSEIINTSYAVGIYVELMHSVRTTDPKVNALFQQMQIAGAEIGNHYIFVDIEIAKHPKIAAIAKNPKLEPFNIVLENIIKQKKYQLKHDEEKIVNIKSISSSQGWAKLFDDTWSNEEFLFGTKKNQKKEKLNEEKLLTLTQDPNPLVRKEAAAAFTEGLKKNIALTTTIYNMLLVDKSQEDKLRGAEYPEMFRHLSNSLTPKSVDIMRDVVMGNFKLVERFYNYKKKILKLKRLEYYDRNAPITLADLRKGKSAKMQNIPYAKGLKEVINAYNSFDPQFAKIVEDLARTGHVDVESRIGKRGGAFCAFAPKPYKPYVLLNYLGKPRDVQTLAHEMGHAIHDVLTSKLPKLVSSAPLVLCETASVFGEMISFEHLISGNLSREEKIILLTEKIGETMSTVFRQTVMYEFEHRVHAYIKANGQIASQKLNEFWLATQREMHGNSVHMGDDYGYWWSYIPHFIHTPFYVYSYSFGCLLTFALYDKYKAGMPNFIKKYKQFLALGGTKTPQEAVKVFGFDLESPDFWQSGMNVFKKLIDTLETL